MATNYEPIYYGPAEPILTQRAYQNIDTNCVSFSASDAYLKLVQNRQSILNSRNGTCACNNICSSDECVNIKASFECNPKICRYGSSLCCNRVFSCNRSTPETYVVDLPGKGLGVLTAEFMYKGGFIGEYVGEILTLQEIKKRTELGISSQRYLYKITTGLTVMIDAETRGNINRLINHSCDPNCIFRNLYVNGHIRVTIFASRDIRPKEEITCDYGPLYANLQIKCLCGAANCGGIIGNNKNNKTF